MPFTKVGKDDYTSPSGRHFNGAQVRLWHANGDKFPGQKTSEGHDMSMIKGHKPMDASYAAGGPVLGRTREFLKEPTPGMLPIVKPTDAAKGPQEYEKKSSPPGKDKSEKAVAPRQ